MNTNRHMGIETFKELSASVMTMDEAVKFQKAAFREGCKARAVMDELRKKIKESDQRLQDAEIIQGLADKALLSIARTWPTSLGALILGLQFTDKDKDFYETRCRELIAAFSDEGV